jgi:hypothetical protein
MNHFDPERLDPSIKREIASHYYPLIGPYDSADLDLIEYYTPRSPNLRVVLAVPIF